MVSTQARLNGLQKQYEYVSTQNSYMQGQLYVLSPGTAEPLPPRRPVTREKPRGGVSRRGARTSRSRENPGYPGSRFGSSREQKEAPSTRFVRTAPSSDQMRSKSQAGGVYRARGRPSSRTGSPLEMPGTDMPLPPVEPLSKGSSRASSSLGARDQY